ncbi:Ig-like domain-containing protein [Chloroflexus sp.]|uniref:Ig-like domain-containing protein n=1 Tax=Chloroflexus sp. TaxID=1904827 RepID=UPI00298F0683|nr:Ig-like domain-containing protein [Chloroflexus sp.]MDW8403529.1 Ig-like domain-containing protein [Chloroflexus sp.]
MGCQRILTLICLLSILATTIPATAIKAEPSAPPVELSDTPTMIGTDSYSAPYLRNGMVFWVATPLTCAPSGVEFPEPCQIRRAMTGGGSQQTIYNSGSTGPFIRSNVAVDDQYAYWIGSDFTIKRKSIYGPNDASAQIIASTAHTTSTLQFSIDVDSNFIFWTESIPSGTGQVGRLYRMPKDGGTRQLMQEYNQPMSKVRADGAGGAFYVAPLFTNILLQTVPSGSGFNTSTANRPFGVQAYAVTASHIYWAQKTTSTSSLIIKRAPRNNLAAVETLSDRGSTGNPTATGLAVHGDTVFWHEVRGFDGPIYRLRVGSTPEAITDNQSSSFGLVVSAYFLVWTSGNVYRLPVNASAWTIDLGVNAMEVIQTIQRPANDVPLVSGKETFVRVFAQILSSNPPRTVVNVWPPALLYGTRSGVPLPESPLEPIPSPTVNVLRSSLPSRRNVNDGFWFRLPASWSDGTVQLRVVVNPRRIISETSYANNELPQTVTFVRKAPICLDLKPVATERGVTFSSIPHELSRDWFYSFFRKAEQLLPTHALRVIARGGEPLRKPRWYLFESDPFGLSRTNADSGWMLFLLNVNTLFDRNLCTDGGDTIKTVMAQDFPEREVNGMQLGNSVLFFTIWEPDGRFIENTPGGGITLAHEIGHYYGRGHINCPPGGPDGVDGGYPYPLCQLDNTGLNEHIGLDARRFDRSLLLPESTGDLLSYAHWISRPRWPSDYTWRAIFNRLATRSGGPAASATTAGIAPAAAFSYIVTGFITGNAAELREIYQLTDPLLSEVTARMNAITTPSSSFRIRAYSGTTLLVDQQLRVNEATAEVGPDQTEPDTVGFFHRLDLGVKPTKIEIVRVAGGTVIGTRNASPNAPTVTITAPTAGSTVDRTLTVSWNASDADGNLLHHLVRYSGDNGATWNVLGQGLTGNSLTVDLSGMPGGSQARVQVITTDGLNTAIATSAPFSVPRRAPQVSGQAEGGIFFPLNEPVVLRGDAYDPEDGPLAGNRLAWEVTGPVTRTGDGFQLTLLNLPPGTYAARLRATDSDGQTGETSFAFVVEPKRVVDGAAPEIDGLCADEGYNADPDPITLWYNRGMATASSAQVRLIRNGDHLYLCLNGLPLSGVLSDGVRIKFDPDNSADAVQQSGDLIFTISRDGTVRSGRGNGTTTDQFDPAAQGILAVINQTSDNWSAELRLDANLFGGWNKRIRMTVRHEWIGFGSIPSGQSVWPEGGDPAAPATWGLTALGDVPGNRIYTPLVMR